MLVCYDAPWRPIGERDAGPVRDQIAGRGPRRGALAAHDSTPWTYRAFARRLGDRYRTLRVGGELRISAGGVRAVAPGGPASKRGCSGASPY